MPQTLLLKDADILVTMDGERREIPGGGLFAEDGIIRQVGPSGDLPQTADRVIDASGHIVLPGFVNTHHHLNQTLTRNLPAAQNNNLFPWLQAHYRIWAKTNPEASRTSTLIGLAELALSGCTTVFDHTYLFQSGNKVDYQIEAARDLGVRFHASRGSMSLGESKGGLPPDAYVEDEEHILNDSIRVIDRYHDASHGAMTRIVLAPCSPFSVSENLLRDSALLARDKGVMLHTHLCETLDEERYTMERFGKRPVEWMQELGWTGPDVWFAHAIHVDDDEIRLFAATGCGAAHCPCSNMRLASGIAPVKKYMAAGVKVGLGVDGSASNDGSNMLMEVRQAMLLARLNLGLQPVADPQGNAHPPLSHPSRTDEWMTAREALELATLGGAAVLGRSDVGSLETGKCADFFTLDLNTIHFAGALHDPVAAVVFCAPQAAKTTVVNGRVIVEDGRIVTMDMAPVIRDHNRMSLQLAAGI
ncbi:8-oxoguanine deaminase [Roseibium marinum]|uniref:Cytosine/adenosine deaminase-related metal-dependent hydrolase n=1 Tax=Roseibium marinum TaxID=281252 RepID=A0A2S3UMW3_9HYPH|nr:8-oxoguanine deaminase [Roseibium marinum]POF29036.1 cytosine/adenosine deaminase-related metal-dependent hydrolase [Roseibium marinum]